MGVTDIAVSRVTREADIETLARSYEVVFGAVNFLRDALKLIIGKV